MPVPVPADALVDQQSILTETCASISPGDLIAIDTEFVRTSQFSPRLCVVQIASGSNVFCVDELAGIDTSPLWDLLCADSGLRVLHAAKQDLEVAWVRYQRLPSPLFDTQIGAALVGQPAQVGYAALAKFLLDIDIDKTHTRADWSIRPLAPELLAYATADVVHLPTIYEILRERLERLGRYEWALEDSATLVDPSLYIADPEQAWRRLVALPRMPVAAQLRGRRLARWREEYAIRADRPRQWILTDRALLDISMRNPRDVVELAACEDMPAGVARRQCDSILSELAAATRELAEGTTLTQDARPEVVDPDELKRLARIVDKTASELEIPPEILATRKDLTALLRGHTTMRPLSGWRRGIVGEALLSAIDAIPEKKNID